MAPDRTKLAAGATEKEKVRKPVAPDGTKLAAGATGKRKVRKTVAPDGTKPVKSKIVCKLPLGTLI